MFWKYLLATLVLILSLFFSYRFFDQQFRLNNVKINWAAEEAAPISAKDKALLERTFSQTFHYLDRGKQSYVFESNDGQQVLKFIDSRCRWSGSFPLISSISTKRCAKKVQRLLNGYRLASEIDRDNTGLIFLQLSKNPSYSLIATLTDRFGITHTIDISQIPFVLQTKAIPTRVVVTDLLNQGNVSAATQRLRQIIDMYVDEYQRGLVDGDHNIMYNTGFVMDKPIRIDVGRLQYQEAIKDPSVYIQDLQKVAVGRVGEWLGRHFPQYRQEIMDDIQGNIQGMSSGNRGEMD